MLHHLSLGVSDMDKSVKFYDSVLSAIGYARVWSDLRPNETGQAVGYGIEGCGDKLAIKQVTQEKVLPSPGFHIAFSTGSNAEVTAFHKAALLTGGKDNGVPGYRTGYGPTYFAAFVLDPDGHHLEAVNKSGA
ncbi:MAG: VOC family protein [Rhodoferax sp.]|nr:VOC family protein [Rhodoferax sp.]